MIISLCFKNFTSNLTQDEILIVDTIISKIDYNVLLQKLEKKFTKKQLDDKLKKLSDKEIIKITGSETFLKNKKNITKHIKKNKIDKVEKIDSTMLKKINRIFNDIKDKKNYYEILGITINSTITEIKTTYFKLSKEFHPDMYKGKYLTDEIKEKVDYISVELTNIYNTLRVKKRRVEYLQSLDIFKNRKNISKPKINDENIIKGKEFFDIATNELAQNNKKKALEFIKMALVYQPNKKEYIDFKDSIIQANIRDNIKSKYQKLDQLLTLKDGLSMLPLVNEIINDYQESTTILLYRIKALELLDISKNKNFIINDFNKIIEFDPSIQNYENYLTYLKKMNEKETMKKVAATLLEIDPKNKLAKTCLKRFKWGIF